MDRQATIRFLVNSGWVKDACGWWTAPFGYSLDEAVQLHKEFAEKTAHAFNDGDAETLKYWLKRDRSVPV